MPAPARLTHAELLRGNAIGCLTAVYDSAALGKVEMPPLRRRQDYGLWLALLARGAVAHGLSQVLADYRVRPGSLSARPARRRRRHLGGLSPGGRPVAGAGGILPGAQPGARGRQTARVRGAQAGLARAQFTDNRLILQAINLQ